MKASHACIILAAAAHSVLATPVELAQRATPTLYLAGDSTMAKKGANDGSTDGWGEYIAQYVSIPVVNRAIGGRSARSYSNEGRFDSLISTVQSGDIVVIEFGHNDGGSPNNANDNGRSDCPGTGNEVCTSGKTGEKVYTFNYYITEASKKLIAKGAKVIISSQTPNNLWEGGTFNGGAPRFVEYAATAAKNVNGASYVDHFTALANGYKKLGSAKTNSYFPKDHTHTSPDGAKFVATSFADAVNRNFNGATPLKQYLKGTIPTTW